MKRLILILLVLVFVLSSCDRPTYGILEYQDRNIEAQCQINEKFKCILEKKEGELTLKILEPTELNTVSFVINDNGALAISKDIKIPLEKESIDGIYALVTVLCLNETELSSAREGENGDAVLTFLNERGQYTLQIGKNQMPKSAEITGDGYHYKITFESIKVN
ncbi:MAG: hypothetical protein IJ309_03440 [Clostridia bacterium]|nr:hypothetical protein [Clostridia bacterium]